MTSWRCCWCSIAHLRTDAPDPETRSAHLLMMSLFFSNKQLAAGQPQSRAVRIRTDPTAHFANLFYITQLIRSLNFWQLSRSCGHVMSECVTLCQQFFATDFFRVLEVERCFNALKARTVRRDHPRTAHLTRSKSRESHSIHADDRSSQEVDRPTRALRQNILDLDRSGGGWTNCVVSTYMYGTYHE